MRIRQVTLADAPALRRYARDLFAEDLPGIYRRPTPTLEEEREFIRAHLEPANSTMFVAEEDGRIVANIGLLGGKLAEESHVGTFGISVARDYRGQGIGTALIEALLEWAPRHGISRIEVQAWSNNPGSARLYHRMGFEDEGRARGAVVRDGQPIDVLMMARLLPQA